MFVLYKRVPGAWYCSTSVGPVRCGCMILLYREYACGVCTCHSYDNAIYDAGIQKPTAAPDAQGSQVMLAIDGRQKVHAL